MPPKAQGRGHFYNKWPPVNRRSSKVSRGVAFMAHPLHPLQHVGQHHHEQVRHVGRGAVQEQADRAVDGEGRPIRGNNPRVPLPTVKWRPCFPNFYQGGPVAATALNLPKPPAIHVTLHNGEGSVAER